LPRSHSARTRASDPMIHRHDRDEHTEPTRRQLHAHDRRQLHAHDGDNYTHKAAQSLAFSETTPPQRPARSVPWGALRQNTAPPRRPFPPSPPSLRPPRKKEYRRGAGARRARYRAQWGGAAAAFITGGRLNTGVLPERAPGDAPTLAAAAHLPRGGSEYLTTPRGRCAGPLRGPGGFLTRSCFLKPAIPPPACHALAECLAINVPTACAGKDFNFTLAARHPCVRKRGPFGIPLWAALPAPAGSAPQIPPASSGGQSHARRTTRN
jgi:hypothetical protein